MYRRHFLKSTLLLPSLASTLACDLGKFSPTAPSEFDNSTNSGLAQDVISKWSPYINVHVTSEATDAYRDAFNLLLKTGAIRGVRVGIERGGEGLNNPIIRMIGDLGIEMLGIIDNLYLFDSNLEQRIDEIFLAYPEIHYFQVGNEITTILPRSGPTMTIEQYMIALKRIYDHVQKNHRPGRAILLTQSTFGSGANKLFGTDNYGPIELERMTNLGLYQMSTEKIIIAINTYSLANANAYVGVINSRLSGYRIWITETGVNDQNLQVSYVQNNYPHMKDRLRSERRYWYALWTGDDESRGPGIHTEFGLIRYPQNYPSYWKSDLFKILTGSE